MKRYIDEKATQTEGPGYSGFFENMIAWHVGCIANRHINPEVLSELRKRAWGKHNADYQNNVGLNKSLP